MTEDQARYITIQENSTGAGSQTLDACLDFGEEEGRSQSTLGQAVGFVPPAPIPLLTPIGFMAEKLRLIVT